MTWRDRPGPSNSLIVAYLRRRSEAAMLTIGGRNLGSRGDREARIELTLDGRVLDSWMAPPDNQPFLTMRTLPAGALIGADRYATLEIRGSASDGSGEPECKFSRDLLRWKYDSGR